MDRIHVPRNPYRGVDKKKRAKVNEENRVAVKIENYLNEKYAMQDSRHQVYDYMTIARGIDEDYEAVRGIASKINGGSNGIILTKDLPI